MTEGTFETREAVQTLQGAGFEAAQARAVVDFVTREPISAQVVKDLERLKVQVETNMATKADLSDLRSELTSSISELRASLLRALWLQSGTFAALIIGLAGLVVAGS